jgi:hypothetical protein
MKKRMLFVVCAAGTLIAPGAWAATAYFNDFESGGAAGPEWSIPFTEAAPGGRRFLGRFVDQEVSLTLNGLPSHQGLKISFDLFVINSWDGIRSPGPDLWSFSVPGASVTLTTTFSNVDYAPSFVYPQSYPDVYPEGEHPPRTGAAEVNALGYVYDPPSGQFGDSVYHLAYDLQHTGSSVQFLFDAPSLQTFPDETWGLDNVLVEILLPTAAGRVPDGAFLPGVPLIVETTASGDLGLSWGSSCAATDVDYEIYEGTLGIYYTHAPARCSTGGATTATLPAPAGSAYYIVVPSSGVREGSYGYTSDGWERPPSPEACLPREIVPACL